MMKNKLIHMLLFASLLMINLVSCKKDVVSGVELNEQQLLAGRLAGTWAKPREIVVPKDVSEEIFGAMRLVFTTDENGFPNSFIAKDCPIVFSNTAGSWNLSGSKVTLTSIAPVDEFDIKVSDKTLSLSFVMGWENTETGKTGQGKFSVTLARQ